MQMARRQVVEQIDGWVSSGANKFRQAVERSSLAPETRRMLHIVTRMRAWFRRDDIALRDTGEIISVEVRRLARTIMRTVMARHSRPDLSAISLRLDTRIAIAPGKADKATHADLWATLRLPNGGTIQVPLLSHHRFGSRSGTLCPVVQLVTNDAGSLGGRLVTD